MSLVDVLQESRLWWWQYLPWRVSKRRWICLLFMIMLLTWVPESTIKGFGWGLGEAGLVAADSRDSSFSILSMRSMVPLARISSTMAMDSASDTGPEPVVVTLGEFATGDPVTPGPGRGERLDSGDIGPPGGSDRLEVKLSRLGKSQPGSQSKSSSSSESPPLSLWWHSWSFIKNQFEIRWMQCSSLCHHETSVGFSYLFSSFSNFLATL